MDGGSAGAAVIMLHAVEAWQQALFGNVRAVREGTQTEEHSEVGEKG